MFDFHMHTTVSYDGKNSPQEMVRAAVTAGLREICFTDHLDYELGRPNEELAFRGEDYNRACGGLDPMGITVRTGTEIGMTPWNVEEVSRDLSLRHYDFVLGSIHHVDNLDLYFQPFWEGKTVEQAEQAYFEEMLRCVELHDNFDVLGHLTYISKTAAHPTHRLVPFEDYRDITAEIMKVLIRKDKGMEVNSSGVDRCGDFLPGEAYLRLFKDLGGSIVTIGSDAHNTARVGQYAHRSLAMLEEIFGHVCTFADRQPVFHKL